MRLTWSKQPSATGLMSVGQGPRGAILKVDGVQVAGVTASRPGAGYRVDGWHWYARSAELGVAFYRSYDNGPPIADLEVAKTKCEAYVREQLKLPPRKPKVDTENERWRRASQELRAKKHREGLHKRKKDLACRLCLGKKPLTGR